mmetsp:Transcript_2753/g.3953  ORF Transcript_2753/g.3953 Transcript_2753/m.3953 type:complete len:105 (-) Transcript_2753:1819-2133(-)
MHGAVRRTSVMDHSLHVFEVNLYGRHCIRSLQLLYFHLFIHSFIQSIHQSNRSIDQQTRRSYFARRDETHWTEDRAVIRLQLRLVDVLQQAGKQVEKFMSPTIV